VSEDRDGLRAADVDREFVADRLRDSLNEGRLTISEYDDRLREAYAARTYGDLKGLLSDLPSVAPADHSQLTPATPPPPPPAVSRGHARRWVAGIWSSWLSASLICTVIWLASGAGSFWPIWVIGPWGAILLASTVSGLAAGEPRRQAERQQAKATERHQAKAAESEQDLPTADRERSRAAERDQRRARREERRTDSGDLF
jgi:hypothetical protein